MKEANVIELFNNVNDNLNKYRHGDFDYILDDTSCSFESNVEFNDSALSVFRMPDNTASYDIENIQTILKSIKNMTPFLAADERLWTYLSHTYFLEYGRTRWPIPDDDEQAIKHIRTHFFADTQRKLERDNLVSRLWWVGYLCSRVSNMNLAHAIEVLLYRTDVRSSIIERPTTAQNVSVFTALVHMLSDSYISDKQLFERKLFRPFMQKINGLGGYMLLDAMDHKSVKQYLTALV
ncbi:MAG: DUF6339 family protein [Gammaproteobacteria bacterium]|nr:DUF6339 family protein [Gammaproteobacteria bacterium]